MAHEVPKIVATVRRGGFEVQVFAHETAGYIPSPPCVLDEAQRRVWDIFVTDHWGVRRMDSTNVLNVWLRIAEMVEDAFTISAEVYQQKQGE